MINNNKVHFKKVSNQFFPPMNLQIPDILQLSKTKTKVIPNAEQSQIIFNYFFYNNFQDFNTWQQIARTKTQYIYQELNNQMQTCKVIFKWQEVSMPIIIQTAEGKNKKESKKNVLKKLITNLVYQGLIGFGFKDTNFVQKLPRRRKQVQSQGQEEKTQQQIHYKKNVIKKLLNEQNLEEALNVLTFQNAIQFWIYSLQRKNLFLCQMILRKLNGQEKYKFTFVNQVQKNQELREENQKKHNILRQVAYDKQFKNPFQEDLTDFIRYYQLQCPKYDPKQFKKLGNDQIDLKFKKLFSEQSMKPQFTQNNSIVKRHKFCSQTFPLQGISQYFTQKNKKRIKPIIQNSFFNIQQEFLEPKFQVQSQKKAFPLKVVESMFNKILLFSLDYEFTLKVVRLLKDNVKEIDMGKDFGNSFLESFYYMQKKQQLVIEFLYILNAKSKCPIISVQGMLITSTNSNIDNVLIFNPKEPEDLLQKKLNKKNNTNEFQEMFEISVDEYVVLVDKLNSENKAIGYIKELYPQIKIISSILLLNCSQTQGQPLPFTLFKLCNSKIFQKLSSAIIQVSKNSINLVACQCQNNLLNKQNGASKCSRFQDVTLIFQPPTFNYFEPIFQQLAEWSSKKYSVLVISQNVQFLYKILQEQGFQCAKIFKKTQEKHLIKYKIVCCSPIHACCQIIKNLAFERVLIHEAHRITQITSLISLTKGCSKLVLMGNPYLCRGNVFSFQSKQLGMNISLFQKLLSHKKEIIIFQSVKNSYFGDSSILEWVNASFYQNKLQLHNQMKTPMIKGVNWPSNQYRISLIHTPFLECQNRSNLINKQAFLCSYIASEVLKSGFTQIHQITCCCIQRSNLQVIQFNFLQILKALEFDVNLYGKIFQKLVRQVDGSVYYENDLILFMVNDDQLQANSYRELISILNMAQRGLIIVGDMIKISQKNQIWKNFINWCSSKKLIMKFEQVQNKNTDQ